MAITYEFIDGVLRFVTAGEVDYMESLSVLKKALAEAAALAPPAPRERWDLLFDIRGSAEGRHADELQGIASVVALHLDALSGRCAVVAGETLQLGLGRVFASHMGTHGVEVVVFRDLEEAEAWLAGMKRLDPR